MPKLPRRLDPDDPVQGFALELRSLRRGAGDPSQAALARAMSCSHSTVSAYLNGTRLPSPRQLRALVLACKGNPSEWEGRLDVARRQLDSLPEHGFARFTTDKERLGDTEKQPIYGIAETPAAAVPSGDLRSQASASGDTSAHKDESKSDDALGTEETEVLQEFDAATLFADLYDIFARAGNAEQIVQSALRRIMDRLFELQLSQVGGAQILFLDQAGSLKIVYSSNSTDIGLVVPRNSVCGRAVREGRAITVTDATMEPEYVRMLGPEMRSEIAIPLIVGDSKRVFGVLNVESAEGDAFGKSSAVVLQAFVENVRSLLAFTQLLADLTRTQESRHTDELLTVLTDQAGNIVHQINNSMGALHAGLIELRNLSSDNTLDSDPGSLTSRIDGLLELTNRALELPEDIIPWAQAGRSPTDLNKRIKRSLGEIKVPVNIRVETTLDNNLPKLSVYGFDVVIRNLIWNAIFAMPMGGRLQISTSLANYPELSSSYVQLRVHDTGEGIAEEALPHIFDMNFTKHSKINRIGQGLMWVRMFVVRSNGTITVNSTPDSGTEFVVTLTLADSG